MIIQQVTIIHFWAIQAELMLVLPFTILLLVQQLGHVPNFQVIIPLWEQGLDGIMGGPTIIITQMV